MFIRSLLVAVVILLFTTPAFSQFGQSNNNNRLVDLADRLSRDATEFADSSYSNFSSNSRALRRRLLPFTRPERRRCACFNLRSAAR